MNGSHEKIRSGRDFIKDFQIVFGSGPVFSCGQSVSESFVKQKEYNDVNLLGTENIFQIAKI
jgi:hypothetical protein